MTEVLLFAAKLMLGLLLVYPFVCAAGNVWVDRWWKRKAEFQGAAAKAVADAFKPNKEEE